MSPKSARRDRGDGSLYQRAKDGLWVGVVDLGYDGQGKRRRKYVTARDYATAVKKLRDLRRTVEDGDLAATSSPTVSKWMARWLDEIAFKKVRPRTLSTYRSYVRNYIEPALGRRRMDQVRPEHVRAMHGAILGAGLSSTTARQAHAILARAFKDARRDGHPCIDVGDRMDPPKRAVSDREGLTSAQAVELVRVAALDDTELAARWWFALLYGERQGERLGLEWDRVDFDAGTVNITWQLQRLPYRHGCSTGGAPTCGRKRGGNCPQRELEVAPGYEVRPTSVGGLWLTRPKSRAGQRGLPLIRELAVVLDGMPRRGPLVFCRDDGSPIDPSEDNKAWHAALEAASLPSLPLHAARHTTATLLRDLGVPREVIVAIMGHSSAVSTDLYIHGDDPGRRAALEGLGALFRLD